MKVAEAVRAIRKHRGMTQQQLAVEMDWAVVTIARYETGRIPKAEVLARLRGLALACGLGEAAAVFLAAMRSKYPALAQHLPSAEAEIQRLRDALYRIGYGDIDMGKGEYLPWPCDRDGMEAVVSIARAALEAR